VQLAAAIMRRFDLVLPPINLVEAALTYVFIVYVAPLPGVKSPHAHRTDLIALLVVCALAWTACVLWGRRTFAPVRRWLVRGGVPTDAERARTVRMPLHQGGQTLAVWSLVAVALGVFEVSVLDGSAGAAVLIAVMVALGGLVASALTYLAAERIIRPAIALALRHTTPVRPLLPGIAARVYLAWEFGTAVAVSGAAVVAIAYLAGAGISPRRLAATVIFLAAIALTVGAVTLLIAVRSVADPVRAVRRAMARVEEGETDLVVPVDDGGEVGLLQAGFNRMLAGLRERDLIRDLFGRHVGEEVARSALVRGTELGGELREAAVLFVDIVGSTAFVAETDAREVVQTLNRFFAICDEVVTLHGGWVNKFEGDAALCVFGAPTEHPDAAGASLAAARELRERLRRELDGLEAAIGLSAGTVVAGNVGAAHRYEYTVIGDPVNEAARLTELAKGRPSRLLASEVVVRRAGAAEATRWSLGEPVTLRGRPRPTKIAVPA
jgi:adenylate cyclase